MKRSPARGVSATLAVLGALALGAEVARAPTIRAEAAASPPATTVETGTSSTSSDVARVPPTSPERCPPEPPLGARRPFAPPRSALLTLLGEAPLVFGSASIGKPSRGALFAGVELGESEGIRRAGGYGWGTELAVRSIERAVREVRRCFPGSPKLFVGDLSREHGGWLRPHASHQSGLDADLGYFYSTEAAWYERATKQNLDVARTWTLVRSLVEGGDVDTIFIDASVQRLLRAHVEGLPEVERAGLALFATPTKRDAVIKHAWGHATHLHVRFADPDAIAEGELLAPRR